LKLLKKIVDDSKNLAHYLIEPPEMDAREMEETGGIYWKKMSTDHFPRREEDGKVKMRLSHVQTSSITA